MIYALLLLGLLPLALFPDGTPVETGDDPDASQGDDSSKGVGDLLDDPADDLLDDPDETEPGTDPGGDPIDPNIEDDVATDEDPDPDDILPPVIDDDLPTPSDGAEGEILDPVDQDDVETDVGEIIATLLDGPAAVPVEIKDFDVGEDVLCLCLNPEVATDNPEIVMQTSDDGEDAEVYAGGALVAVLKGTPNATLADIHTQEGVILP